MAAENSGAIQSDCGGQGAVDRAMAVPAHRPNHLAVFTVDRPRKVLPLMKPSARRAQLIALTGGIRWASTGRMLLA